MRGADPTIAYVDDDMGPMAIDYYLSDYVQVKNNLAIARCREVKPL